VEGALVGGGRGERLLIFFPMHGIFAQACRTEVMSIDGPHRLAVSPLAPEFAKPLEHVVPPGSPAHSASLRTQASNLLASFSLTFRHRLSASTSEKCYVILEVDTKNEMTEAV
jgi:hypothetical protein